MQASQNAGIAPPPATAGQPAQAGGGNVSLTLNAPGTVANGTTFQVPVVLTGGTDIASVPLQIQYDPTKLTLVNVGNGDLLNRDGQTVEPAHRDDGPGNLTLNVSRPPGAPGVSGAGVVCVLTFEAKAQGETNLSITRAGVTNSAGKPVPAQTTDSKIVVQ
jgi:general secretion pathway protein D